MVMQRREALIPTETVDVMSNTFKGDFTKSNITRCRHKLGTVSGICLSCGQFIIVCHSHYNNTERRMEIKEEVKE